MDFIYDNLEREIFTNYLDFRDLENIKLSKLKILNQNQGHYLLKLVIKL